MLNKRDELYNAWKVMELEFRQDHRNRHLKFSATDYDKALGLTEESHKLRKEFQEFISSSQTVAGWSGPPYHGNTAPFPHRVFPWGSSHSLASSQPFSSGSSKSSSTAVCLICAQRGHTFSPTSNPPPPPNLPTGRLPGQNVTQVLALPPPTTRPFASTGMFGVLTTSQCTSVHKDDCLHLCSFCGSKSHHALSWTCCTKTS